MKKISQILVFGLLFISLLPASAGLKIYYIRHGQSGANVSKDFEDTKKEDRPDYVGDPDSFSPLGQTQVAAVPEKLKPYHFDFIAVSPKWRARNTILPYLTAEKRQGEIWPELAEFSQSKGGFKLIGTAGLPAPAADLLGGTPVVLPDAEKPFFILNPDDLREIKVRSEDAASNGSDLTKLQELVVEKIQKRFGGTDTSILLVGHSNAGRALEKVLLKDPNAGQAHIENTGVWMAEEQPDHTFKLMILNDKPVGK